MSKKETKTETGKEQVDGTEPMADDEVKDVVGGARRNWPPGTGPGSPRRSYDVTGRIRPYLRRTGQI